MMRRTGLLLIASALVITGALPASASDYGAEVLAATYKLYNRDSTATAFFVRTGSEDAHTAATILVTALHVMTQMSGDTAVIVLRRHQADGSYQRGDFPITVRAQGKPLWTANPHEDVAVMRVDLPADAQVTVLPENVLATEADLAQVPVVSSVFFFGYPTTFEAPAGFPIARHGTVASFPLTPLKFNPTFLLDTTTFAGDSGGPVFIPDPRHPQADQSHPLILGMVVGRFHHDEQATTFYEERTIHYPLGLAIVLPAVFIQETIALLGK